MKYTVTIQCETESEAMATINAHRTMMELHSWEERLRRLYKDHDHINTDDLWQAWHDMKPEILDLME